MQYFILNKKAVFNHTQGWIFQSKYRFCFVFGRFTIHVVLVLGNLHYVIFYEHETTEQSSFLEQVTTITAYLACLQGTFSPAVFLSPHNSPARGALASHILLVSFFLFYEGKSGS